MVLKIFDTSFNLIGVVDAFNSLRWTRKFYSGGEWEIEVPLNAENIKLFKRENIIYKGDDDAGYIETVEIFLDQNGLELINAKGKFITNYTQRRITWGYDSLDGTVEDCMRSLVNSNCISCPTERKINYLELGTKANITTTCKKSISFENLFESLEYLSKSYDVGFKIKYDPRNKKLVFISYQGKNRTVNQSILAPVIFSRDFENILEQNYFDSLNNYKNVCLVAGTGEGSARKRTTVGFATGLNRYELYADAKDISDKKTVSEPTDKVDDEGNTIYKDTEVAMTDIEYIPLLKQRGTEKLSECIEINTFDSTINALSNSMKYKVDFDLGDKVTVIDRSWGITVDTLITEIEEVYEQSGLKVNVIFGNNIPTIIDKIKSLKR